MTSLICLLIAGLFAVAYSLIKLIEPEPKEMAEKFLSADLKLGQIEVSIRYEKRSCPFFPNPTVNLWAIAQDIETVTPDLYHSLQAELDRDFPGWNAKVTQLHTIIPDRPEVELSKSELASKAFLDTVESMQAIADSNAPILKGFEEDVESYRHRLIKGMVNQPGKITIAQ